MLSEQVQKLNHGLYKIYWIGGGSSLAAVGSFSFGQRWFAPTNWVNFVTEESVIGNWQMVDRVEPLQPHFQPLDRERLEGLLEDFKHDLLAPESKGHPSLKSSATSYYADKIEALQNEGSDPLADEFQVEQFRVSAGKERYLCDQRVHTKIPCERCKPVCQTCGGFRQRCPSPCEPGDDQLCEPQCRHWILCPDCTVKHGEQQRKGETRRGVFYGRRTLDDSSIKSDRRDGKERRQNG